MTQLEGMDRAEIEGLEVGGYTYCYQCESFEDDAYCYPGDHSRHCGHAMKPHGHSYEPTATMRLLCVGMGGKVAQETGRRLMR